MKLLGERNWWAPAPLRRFHDRYGLHEPPAIMDVVGTAAVVIEPAVAAGART
jgi:RND superfamily putative drug exporter